MQARAHINTTDRQSPTTPNPKAHTNTPAPSCSQQPLARPSHTNSTKRPKRRAPAPAPTTKTHLLGAGLAAGLALGLDGQGAALDGRLVASTVRARVLQLRPAAAARARMRVEREGGGRETGNCSVARHTHARQGVRDTTGQRAENAQLVSARAG